MRLDLKCAKCGKDLLWDGTITFGEGQQHGSMAASIAPCDCRDAKPKHSEFCQCRASGRMIFLLDEVVGNGAHVSWYTCGDCGKNIGGNKIVGTAQPIGKGLGDFGGDVAFGTSDGDTTYKWQDRVLLQRFSHFPAREWEKAVLTRELLAERGFEERGWAFERLTILRMGSAERIE